MWTALDYILKVKTEKTTSCVWGWLMTGRAQERMEVHELCDKWQVIRIPNFYIAAGTPPSQQNCMLQKFGNETYDGTSGIRIFGKPGLLFWWTRIPCSILSSVGLWTIMNIFETYRKSQMATRMHFLHTSKVSGWFHDILSRNYIAQNTLKFFMKTMPCISFEYWIKCVDNIYHAVIILWCNTARIG